MRRHRELWSWARRLCEAISRDQVLVYAAQASFILIIAMFPFAMLLLSLVQYVLPMGQQEIAEKLAELLPEMMMEPVREVLDELFARPTVSLISVTAITSLWTASRGLNAVKNGLRTMYRTAEDRGFLYNTAVSLLYTVLFLIALLGTLLLLVFGTDLLQAMLTAVPWMAYLITPIFYLRFLIFPAFLTLFFMIVYRTLSGQKLSFKRQFPGALFATLGWILFSVGFSIYIRNFGHYSLVYGGLTAMVVVMLWLYMCMAILLVGAEINVFLLRKTRLTAAIRHANRLPKQ